MKESTDKEKILKSVRNALINKQDLPYQDIDLESEVYDIRDEDIVVVFAEELKSVSGHFYFCQSDTEFVGMLQQLKDESDWETLYVPDDRVAALLTSAKVPFTQTIPDAAICFAGITLCECLIARTGSVMVSTAIKGGRRGVAFPDDHIVMAYLSQVVADLKNAFVLMKEKYNDKLPSLITVITGPSRTADIEKTLIMGAHGPKKLHVFLFDDTNNNMG